MKKKGISRKPPFVNKRALFEAMSSRAPWELLSERCGSIWGPGFHEAQRASFVIRIRLSSSLREAEARLPGSPPRERVRPRTFCLGPRCTLTKGARAKRAKHYAAIRSSLGLSARMCSETLALEVRQLAPALRRVPT